MPVGDVFFAAGPFLFAELEVWAPEFSPVECELGFAEFCLFDCICFHITSICKHGEQKKSILVSNTLLTV